MSYIVRLAAVPRHRFHESGGFGLTQRPRGDRASLRPLQLIYVNPVLAALGYHLIQIEQGNGKVSILLSRRAYVRPDTRLGDVPAGDMISIEATNE